MKEERGLVSRFLEIRRLMQRSGIRLDEALDLLEDQLSYFEETTLNQKEREHVGYPLWLYGQ